jgi:hypothetical protein
MTIKAINITKLAAALAPVALAGAIMAPTAAAAPMHDAPGPSAAARVDYSQGFHIYNLSSHRLKLVSVTGSGNFEGRPNDGDILQPGVGYHDWEVQYRWVSPQFDRVTYQILDDGGQVVGKLTADLTVTGDVPPAVDSDCSTTFGTCSADDKTLTFTDPPGTVIDLPAGQGEAQAQSLKQFCQQGSAAMCTFTPTKEEHTLGPAHQFGNAVQNYTDEEDDTTVSAKDTVVTTDSVGVEVSTQAEIAEVVKVAVSATYGRQWTTEHDFSQDVDVKVAPHREAWVEVSQPLIRDTGDFTMTLGNTTWKLHDVYFDSPDQNGTGTYAIKDKPLS